MSTAKLISKQHLLNDTVFMLLNVSFLRASFPGQRTTSGVLDFSSKAHLCLFFFNFRPTWIINNTKSVADSRLYQVTHVFLFFFVFLLLPPPPPTNFIFVFYTLIPEVWISVCHSDAVRMASRCDWKSSIRLWVSDVSAFILKASHLWNPSSGNTTHRVKASLWQWDVVKSNLLC